MKQRDREFPVTLFANTFAGNLQDPLGAENLSPKHHISPGLSGIILFWATTV
jgi:hypothetical protein